MGRPAVTSDNIDSYMSRINRIERIDRDEELRLSRIMHSDAPEQARLAARDRLVCANLRLVVKIAHDFKRYNVGFADLVAEGNRGLITAAMKFDPDNGAKFSVYAGWWIKQSMRRAIQWQCRVIRVPGGAGQRYLNIRKAADRILASTGVPATEEQLAEETGYPLSSVHMLLGSVPDTVSLSEPVAGDTDTTYGDLVDAGADTVERDGRCGLLHAALDRLSQLDRRIVADLFGLSGHPVDAQSLSREVGMTVCQLRSRLSSVLACLRGMIEAGMEDGAATAEA